jgi:ATP-dependent DNA ligase
MFSVCEEIFQGLKAIAQTAGKGAVEREMAGLSDVLRQVGSASAKYVVRILLGNEHGHALSENHRGPQ